MGGEVFLGETGAFWERFTLEPLHRLAAVSFPFQGRLLRVGKFWGWNGGLLGRWDPSTAWRRSPSPRGEAFGGGKDLLLGSPLGELAP